MKPVPTTILDWREHFDSDLPVIEKQVEAYCKRVLVNARDVDIETFVLIEQCNAWHKAYTETMHALRPRSSGE